MLARPEREGERGALLLQTGAVSGGCLGRSHAGCWVSRPLTRVPRCHRRAAGWRSGLVPLLLLPGHSARGYNAPFYCKTGANYRKQTCPQDKKAHPPPPTKFLCIRGWLGVGRSGSAAVTLYSVHAFPRATATGIPPLPSLALPSSSPEPTSQRAGSSLLSDEAVS